MSKSSNEKSCSEWSYLQNPIITFLKKNFREHTILHALFYSNLIDWGLKRHYLKSIQLKWFDHDCDQYSIGDSKIPFFVSTVEGWNNHLPIEIRHKPFPKIFANCTPNVLNFPNLSETKEIKHHFESKKLR